tara:strand:+ start:312 stop:539 length:228 start_codon:yes stop_codon:yes gene_type:complete
MEDTRLDRLEKEISDLKDRLKVSDKSKKEKKPRAPSEYNSYVKKYLSDEKLKLGENYNHKIAFKNAAEAWSKNKK